MVMRPPIVLIFAFSFALFHAGCKRAPDAASGDRPILREAPRPGLPSQAILHERSGRGRVAYLGLDASPSSPERGQLVEVTQYFKVLEPMSGDYDVFLHGEVPGSGRLIVADHPPAQGRFLTSRWRKDEIWVDRDRVLIPKDLPAGTIELYAGLFKGDVRLTVEAPPGASDGEDRVKVGTLKIQGEGPKGDLPEVVVHRATSPIKADGELDESDWAKAEVMTFSDSLGREGTPRYPTKLRLLYDDQNLYVGFECTDEDITERYSKRDDPIYEHETAEIFIMPHVIAPALGPYVELQASPGGVIFDAAFTARRQGMDVSFNAGQTVATKIHGTLNKSDDKDQGWVSEWIVPWQGIRGVKEAPKPGDEWRMNAFRIEKWGPADHLNGEFTAWSPPRVGDFHNTERFGRMKFGT
jgi:hypothetical protein